MIDVASLKQEELLEMAETLLALELAEKWRQKYKKLGNTICGECPCAEPWCLIMKKRNYFRICEQPVLHQELWVRAQKEKAE